MSSTCKAIVETVAPGSIAAEIGINPGDEILTINGQRLQDLIDYQYGISDEMINIAVKRPDGHVWTAELEKDYDEDLGVGFASAVFDKIRSCHNACLFCFVDQMPPGMRQTLYVKDDDYRMSFLYGNFITLTNLRDEDFARILRLRLSPLFVSVHTTDGALRQKMLRQPRAADIMPGLKRLVDAGIDIHAQIVLCPGINDGASLDNTLRDLSHLGPGILSIAIVPVGLTNHREGLFPLRLFSAQEAAAVIEQVKPWQRKFAEEYGEAMVYVADEFYLTAGQALPDYEHYGDFPQIENGVGLSRMFIEQWDRAVEKVPRDISQLRKVSIVAGVSGARVLAPLLEKLKVGNVTTQLITVKNDYFGEQVTVSGLLTGRDILKAIKNADAGDAVIIPGSALRKGEAVFLDGLSLEGLRREVPVPILVADEPEELLRQILG